MKANNQDEGSMRDAFLFLSIITIISVAVVIIVLITSVLYAINASASPASSLYLSLYAATVIIFFALILYIVGKVTKYEGGGNDG